MHVFLLDVSDLQKFVNVALTTAAGGEGDLTNDRLSSLRRVGSGFSSLIYDLGPHSGSRELRSKCSIVWDAYKNDKKLPQMLVYYVMIKSCILLLVHSTLKRIMHSSLTSNIAKILTRLC